MSFFRNIANKLKDAGNFVIRNPKKVISGALEGITRAANTGRKIIGITRDVAERLKDVPRVGSILKRVIDNPLFAAADEGLGTVSDVSKRVGDVGSASGFIRPIRDDPFF